ncbi:MAG: ROK family protein [Spirochaetales bacterium]
MKGKTALGLDLGGTKMLCGAVAPDGTVLATEKKKTRAGGDPDQLVERMVKCVRACMTAAELEVDDVGVLGVAAPGPIDVENGILTETSNIGVSNFPLSARLQEELGFPVVLENDVNAGLYGEFMYGHAYGLSEVVGLFPGTGVGGAMILGGSLYRGAGGGAGELGHMVLQPGGPICGCGKRGCLETLASRGAIAREIALLVAIGRAPTVAALTGSDPSLMKSGVIAEAVSAGEQAVIEIVERSAWWLGLGMANCVNIFNPQAIVLGGGLVEKLGEHYIGIAERTMREQAMTFPARDVRVIPAILGDNAAIVGAARRATEAIEA